MTADKVKERLRFNIQKLDQEIKSVIESYKLGSISLDEYMGRRATLEQEKERKVLENLRNMRIRK